MNSGEGRKGGKDDAERHVPPGFAGFCKGIMPPNMEECCGPRMKEMMSRCMARLQEAQGDQGKAEEKEE